MVHSRHTAAPWSNLADLSKRIRLQLSDAVLAGAPWWRRLRDRLTQNDEGAFATGRMLQQDRSRLDGKRVVIFQFAARGLTAGDWTILPLSPGRPGE